MTKTFVLRINSLLSSSDSTLRFGSDNEVVIPLAVIDQLENYRGNSEKKKIAESILAYIETFDIKELMDKGAKQVNGSILRIIKNFHDVNIEMEGITDIDRRVFQVCLGLQKEKEKKVILVSKNSAIRIKARSLGINAEDFRDDLFPSYPEQYTGRVKVETRKKVVDDFEEKGVIQISDIINSDKITWITNMFVEGKAVDAYRHFLGRYDGEKIVKLVHDNLYPFGINCKNDGQKMLMECLMMDCQIAPLVIAKGGAGTGKTFCSLAAALEGQGEGTYSRILVGTPSETVGNEKLGYLPGDMKEKVSPYLGGIYDNLSILINGIKKKEKGDNLENGEYLFEKGVIQVQPIGFLRGRTITNSIFIIDETQNIDPGDIKSIVTRAAVGSKFIFLGDPTQVDNPKLNERYNGLVYLSEKMKGNPLCWQVSLQNEESVRSELSRIASKIL